MQSRLLFSAAFAVLSTIVPQPATATPPPPESVELTPARMKALGFVYRIWRKGDNTSISLEFPLKIPGNLTAHSTHSTTWDLRGRLLQRSDASSRHAGYLDHTFNHRRVDVSVTVAYCEPNVSGCKDYVIKSVSRLFKNDGGR